MTLGPDEEEDFTREPAPPLPIEASVAVAPASAAPVPAVAAVPAPTTEGCNSSSSQSLIFGGGGHFLTKYGNQQNDREVRQRARVDGPRASGGTDSGSAPGRIQVQLNASLVQSRTSDKILQIVDLHLESFNAVNLITALHRLATVCIAAKKGHLRRDVRFKRLMHRLADTLRSANAGALKPQDLSNVAWALTKLSLLNASLFGHLADHIMLTISSFEPVNLSMTLWAFARSGFLDEKLFRAAAAEVKNQLVDFQPQQIANTTWAMAKSGFVDESLFMSAADLALEKLNEFQPMNYSMLLYSFALAKLPHPRLFEEVGRQCTVQALSSALSAPHVITNLALAYSEAGVANEQVFQVVALVASSTLYNFRTQQIATLTQAFARANVSNERLFSCISQAVVGRLAEFKHQDLEDLLSAYKGLGLSIADITHAIQAQQCQDSDTGGRCWLVLAFFLSLFFVLAMWRVQTG